MTWAHFHVYDTERNSRRVTSKLFCVYERQMSYLADCKSHPRIFMQRRRAICIHHCPHELLTRGLLCRSILANSLHRRLHVSRIFRNITRLFVLSPLKFHKESTCREGIALLKEIAPLTESHAKILWRCSSSIANVAKLLVNLKLWLSCIIIM